MCEDESGELFEQLTLGIVKYLHKQDGICSIKLDDRKQCGKTSILSWEQKYLCMLPDDLKNFYLTTDGFLLTWRFKPRHDIKDTDGSSTIAVGHAEINRIENLVKLAGFMPSSTSPSACILDLESDNEDDENSAKPHFDLRSRIFELDSCQGYGKVCLVYQNTKAGLPAQSAEVWFLSRSLQWYYLAPNFTIYFRLLMIHLGLPQWYYIYTDMGLPPQARQWFNLFAPKRLNIDDVSIPNESTEDDAVISDNPLEIGRIFKGRVDKKKAVGNNVLATRKKGLGSGSSSTGTRTQGFITNKQNTMSLSKK